MKELTHKYPARARHMALRAAMKALATTPMLSRTAEVARVAPRGSRPHPRPSPRLAAPRSATCLFRRVFRPEARGRPRLRAVGAGLARARWLTMGPPRRSRSTRTPSRFARVPTRAPAARRSGHPPRVPRDLFDRLTPRHPPRSPNSQGTRALAKLAMLVYWNAGQDGFWDPTYDGTGLDLSTPLGFEPLVASDPAALRREVLSSLVPSEPALWLDPDPGMGPLTPSFATAQEARDAASGLAKPRPSVSRVAVVRLAKPDWIAVIFRGTTLVAAAGVTSEGQVNSMAGQETWEETPLAWGGRGDDEGRDGPRVHRGYAAAYRTVLAEVEGAVSAHARAELGSRRSQSRRRRVRRRRLPGHAEDTREADACKVIVVGQPAWAARWRRCARPRLAHDPTSRDWARRWSA